MKIGVIYGGISSEREISIKTAKEIIKNLKKDKYEVVELLLNSKEDIFKIKDLDVDFVYIGLHGKFGEDGKVQAVLETLGIPYSGSGVLTSAICMDKDIAKRVISSYGINTPNWWTIRKGEQAFFPEGYEELIIKPNNGGSSIGTRFVKNLEEVNEALEEIFKIDEEAIMEEVVRGVEISVPIIGDKVYPPVIIEALKGSFFDYQSKYDADGAREYAHIFEESLQKEIENYTKKAAYAVKCSSFARVDYIISNNIPYLIEINTLPGMTQTSLVPKSLKYLGIDYADTLDLLIEKSR